MKNTLKKVIILFIAVFIFLIGCIYLFFNVRKIDNTKLIINSGVSTKTELIANNNVKSDEIRKLSDDLKLDLALKKQLQIFKENKEKNLGDYQQLMWIYIDMGEYEKVISLGLKALVLYKEQGNNNLDIKHEIYGHIIQAYLYMGKLNEAETLINKYNNHKFLFEKIILEYKKGNYGYIISNYDEIKNESPAFIGFELDLLAKAYIKKGKNEEAIKMYEEIYQYGKDIKNDDVILETFYGYISSYSLKELYSKQGNTQKLDFYNSEFTSFKNRIDNEETLKGSSGDVKMNKKSMYFFLNRQNEL